MENKDDMFHISQEMYFCLPGKVHVVVFHILSDFGKSEDKWSYETHKYRV